MTDEPRPRSSLKDFDVPAARAGQDDASELVSPARTQSGLSDAAETQTENLRRIGDAARTMSAPKGAAAEAIARATAPVGTDEAE